MIRGVEKTVVVCDCDSLDHILRLTVFDDGDPECYLSIHLNSTRSFLDRLVGAFRYLFKLPCRYGHYDEMILNLEDARRLRGALNKFVGLNRKLCPR